MFLLGAALLYPYIFIHTKAIIAAAFFQQFSIQGACGVVPIHLMELSPAAIRTFVVGKSYQLGNLASSASSTIEATIGQRFPLVPLVNSDGNNISRYDYGKVICIFAASAYAFLFIIVIIGPEQLGAAGIQSNLQEPNSVRNDEDPDKSQREHIEYQRD